MFPAHSSHVLCIFGWWRQNQQQRLLKIFYTAAVQSNTIQPCECKLTNKPATGLCNPELGHSQHTTHSIVPTPHRNMFLNLQITKSQYKLRTFTHTGYFPVNLSSILAFWVRVFWGSHFQHAHSKSIDIHRFIVVFLIHFWSHKFWCTYTNMHKKNVNFLWSLTGFNHNLFRL